MTGLFIWSQKNPLVAIIILVGLSVLAATQILKTELDSSSDPLMLKNDPAMDYYEETLHIFGSDTMLIIFVHEEELITVEKLAAQEE